MSSRMEKYSNDSSNLSSRTKRNEELYKTVSLNMSELDSFDLSSNVAVLGDNESNIDVDKIRQMLEYRYSEAPKRRSIKLEAPVPSRKKLDETKEYDINAVLTKAKATQEHDYETDRLRKLRDTQYNILKDLDFELERLQEETAMGEIDSSTAEAKLMDLINTITHKEQVGDDVSASLDLLEDLKGTDDTVTIPAVTEEQLTGIKPEVQATIKDVVKEEVSQQIDKSFYTNSMAFTKSDFDDFNDLKSDVKSSKGLIKILIVLIAIVLVVGLTIILNSLFGWGLF